MNAQKIIKTIQPIELDITGITLLSAEEAKEVPEDLRVIREWWWLRSPGYYAYRASLVTNDGYVDTDGHTVDDHDNAVRPALRVSNLNSVNLQIGDEVALADHTWTVIPGGMALMNDIIGYYPFRKDWQAEDANDYEKSDVKKYLEAWAKEKGITNV